MADYNRSEALDLALYDMPALQPREPEYQPEHELAPARQSGDEKRREFFADAAHALKIFAVAVTLLTLFASILFSRISLAVLEREATQIQTKISEAKSENTRLQMLFNSSVSREKVEEYAVSVLGMQKLERYQIHYFEDRDGDEVVVADGEAVVKADNN